MSNSVQYCLTLKTFSTGIVRLRKGKLIFSFSIRNLAIILKGNWQQIFLGKFYIQSDISRISSMVTFSSWIGKQCHCFSTTISEVNYYDSETVMNRYNEIYDSSRKIYGGQWDGVGGFSPTSSNFTYGNVCTISPCLYSIRLPSNLHNRRNWQSL
jgi:hypothetical protein